jgi:carboxyl-terminal processing protease
MLEVTMLNKTRGFVLLLAGICIGAGLSASARVLAAKFTALPGTDGRLLAEVMRRVQQAYVDPVDDRKLLEGAVRGMVASLDPYSEYLDDDAYDEIKVSTTGEYSGVGIEVAMQGGEVVIVAPIDGTPAALAGIRSGDELVAIDGIEIDHSSLAAAISRMRGKAGSPVRVTVRRAGSEDTIDFPLLRARIELHSVKAELPRPGQGYVRISHFSESTGEDLNAAISQLIKQNAAPLKGLVLDLRDNPGGVLDAAVDVSDAFLDHGVIVTASGRTSEANFEMDATAGDRLGGAPIVVLVDGGSASASEIVAGALKDQHRAVLMGAKTFGKGSVQTLIQLSDGHAVKLTTSRYFTPSGLSIHGKGIVPDILWNPPAAKLAQLDQAAAKKPLLERDAEVKQAFDELAARTVLDRRRHPIDRPT